MGNTKAIQSGIVLGYGSTRRTAELAHLAEECGWDGIFVGDAVWTEDPLIRLTAAAMTTTRIKLATMILAVPLRTPWMIASQALALDLLSEGRLILGLGTGATWMGWQAFPSLPTGQKIRAEMLDETIDILTGLFQRLQFDYPGKHFPLELSKLDTVHFPPPSRQQPRVPIWVPALLGHAQSMARAGRCDGFFPLRVDDTGKPLELAPQDLTASAAIPRPAGAAPLDIIVEGQTGDLDPAQAREKLAAWAEAGMTWWVESTWGLEDEPLVARIRKGPPGVGK